MLKQVGSRLRPYLFTWNRSKETHAHKGETACPATVLTFNGCFGGRRGKYPRHLMNVPSIFWLPMVLILCGFRPVIGSGHTLLIIFVPTRLCWPRLTATWPPARRGDCICA